MNRFGNSYYFWFRIAMTPIVDKAGYGAMITDKVAFFSNRKNRVSSVQD